MESRTTTEETRPGFIFRTQVGKRNRIIVPVKLFIRGQSKPVGTVKLEYWRGDNIILGDIAFQMWVTEGFFHKTVTDPNLLSVLVLCQRERRANLVWYRRTFRFVLAEGGTEKNILFILTTDKSDLSDRQKRILEVGEDAVEREEAEREAARKLREKNRRDHKEEMRIKHAQLIRMTVRSAIDSKSVPLDDVKTLDGIGLLRSSTNFRHFELYPGECSVLEYQFAEGETVFSGFIGFDSDLHLISIDERLPTTKTVYLRKS